MALVLCFHFQLGELRGINVSVVSERMSSQSSSVSPSYSCPFIVYSITDIWCVFVYNEDVSGNICYYILAFQELKAQPDSHAVQLRVI